MSAETGPDAEAPPRPDRAGVLASASEPILRWALKLLAAAALLYVLGWIVGATWVIWFPVLLALLVSTVLAPPVTWLRGKGWPDVLAAMAVLLVGFGTIGVLLSFMVSQIIEEAPGIADQATGGLRAIQEWATEGPLQLSADQIDGYLAAIASQIQSSADVISSGVFAGLSSATNAVVNLAIILVLTFLFIKDGHRFLPWVDRVSGRRIGLHLTEALARVWRTIGGFIRTQALVSLIDAVLIGIGLVIVGVPLALPLSLLVFFGGFIPIVGAFVTGALAVLVTLVTNGPTAAIIVFVIILGVQQLEGNVLSPWLQGKIMRLHAALVLLSVTAGGTLFGITGAFLAVPVIAAVAEVLRYLDEQVTKRTAPEAEPGRTPDAGDEEARALRRRLQVGVSDEAVPAGAPDPARPQETFADPSPAGPTDGSDARGVDTDRSPRGPSDEDPSGEDPSDDDRGSR